MAKPAKLCRAKQPKQATVPQGDVDTVTITVLDTAGQPYTGPLTFTVAAVSNDTTTLTIDTPSGNTYGEHFLKAGSVTVAITATFSDGSTLTLNDSVVISGAPGSLVATHSIPIVGP